MIIALQRRARELGRIRIGQVQPTQSGKTRPAKLDRFRITAHSRDLIQKIVDLYGGEPAEWQPQGGGPAGWEVITNSTRLPILVPPQPITQYLEHWSRGGCARRCDGVHELLSDQACICGPDPGKRLCRPTTRLNVVLREVEGIGVFRLETKGWYAATELPMAAELLAQAGGYISGYLGLEERVVKRDGETLRFMVPTLDVDITPTQLMSGDACVGAAGPVTGGPAAAVAAPTPVALPAASLDVDSVRAAIEATTRLEKLREMWPEVRQAGLTEAATARAKVLQEQPADPPREMRLDQGDGPPEDPDDVWAEVMRKVPEDWTTSQVEQDFAAFAQTPVEQASAADMRRYLDALPQRTKASA